MKWQPRESVHGRTLVCQTVVRCPSTGRVFELMAVNLAEQQETVLNGKGRVQTCRMLRSQAHQAYLHPGEKA